MFSRSMRAETRNRARDELKRVIHSIDKVRKWEKKWVVIKDTTMKIYKWVPVSDTSSGHALRSPLSGDKKFSASGTSTSSSSKVDVSRQETTESVAPVTMNNDDSRDATGSDFDTTVHAGRPPTEFTSLNEDSNAGYSEGGFESDSNMAFGAEVSEQNSSQDAAADANVPSTDFSAMRPPADATADTAGGGEEAMTLSLSNEAL